MSILSLLIVLLVCCVVFWAAQKLMAAFGVGDPIRTVVMVILVIILLYWILSAVGLLPMGPHLNLR
jgi:hypothetical protein